MIEAREQFGKEIDECLKLINTEPFNCIVTSINTKYISIEFHTDCATDLNELHRVGKIFNITNPILITVILDKKDKKEKNDV